MTRVEISHAVGNISSNYIHEAEQYFHRKDHSIAFRRIFVLAAILITVLSLCAFTYTIFSAAAGDNLIITANYSGEGVVLARIQNQSDRDLKIEPKIKLMYYSTREEIPQTGKDPVITGLTIPAQTTQTVRIDLRLSYDYRALENLTNDFVSLQITNKNFHIGHKWTCNVSFRPAAGEYTPQYVTTGDTERAKNVIPSLKAYFENFTPDLFARWADVPEYLELVELELGQVDGNIVAAVDPYYYWDFEEFDANVLPSCFDGYNKLLGRTDMEKINTVNLFVPRLLDDVCLDGQQPIPIFYFWIFPRDQIQSPDDYAFIRGNLLTFREMEAYKVFEDAEHVIYEMHHLVYSDLRNYVEEMLIQNDSIYFDEAIWQRVQRFYEKYSNHAYLSSCIKPLDERWDRKPMEMEDVLSLSKRGDSLTFSDLKFYSHFWQDIDYDKGYGVAFHIDSDYELYYSLEPDGTFQGYYLYHNPTGDKIDIRYADVSKFVSTHGEPQPRCRCENTEIGTHGWQLTLDWLITMDEEVIISYLNNLCHYSLDDREIPTYYYPLTDAAFHLEVDWSIASGIPSYRDENIWLIHDKTGDRCNVRTEDVETFIEAHE